MTKKIAIISLVFAVLLVSLYSAFWFIYADQTTKRINNFVHENADHVSVGDVEVTGFPFKQSIQISNIKLNIPNPALDQYFIVVKEAQATLELFDDNMELTSMGQVLVQDAQGNEFGVVEFNRLPEIEMTLDDHVVEEFYYEDNGYRILDRDKIALYIADSSEILYEGEIDDDNVMKVKLKVAVKGMQGFDISNIYHNVIEDRVVASAQSGQIHIRKDSDGLHLAPAIEETSETQINDDIADGQEVMSDQVEELLPEDNVDDIEIVKADDGDDSELELAYAVDAKDEIEVQERQLAFAKKQLLMKKLENEKGNVDIELEYELKPNYKESNSAIGALGREISYVDRMIKVKKFEYNNGIYSIYVNGRINMSQDDRLPSGAISVNVEGMDDFVGHLLLNFEDIVNQKTADTESEISDFLDSDLLMAKEDIVQVVTVDPAEVKKVAQEIVIESDEAVVIPVMDNNSVQKIEAQAVAKEIVIESDVAVVAPVINKDEESDKKIALDCANPVVAAETIDSEDRKAAFETPMIMRCGTPSATGEEIVEIEETIEEQDPYKAFLRDLIETLPELSQEISAKNQLSEGQAAVFDLRRDENDSTILINEAVMSEIFVIQNNR